MSTNRPRKIPVFITHAWRFHDDWNRLASLMEQVQDSPWVNYSIPWYDPSIRVHRDAGKEKLESMLLTQILPAKFIIFLCGVYSTKSAQVWFNTALDIAHDNRKTVLLMPGFADRNFDAPDRLANSLRVSWDLEELRNVALDLLVSSQEGP